jgi:hypothetical protein
MRIAVSREPGAEREVSPLELFFDLVYVFAIGQLSHHLVAHVDLRTAAETVIMALAVFYAWYMVALGGELARSGPAARTRSAGRADVRQPAHVRLDRRRLRRPGISSSASGCSSSSCSARPC